MAEGKYSDKIRAIIDRKRTDPMESPKYSVSKFRRTHRTATKCLTSEIPHPNNLKRTGITPFCKKDGANIYFICVDAKYGSLTDPGGGFGPPETEDFVVGGTRELNEETMGIFDYTSDVCIEHVRNNSVAIHDGSMVMMFQAVDTTDPDKICQLFRRRYLHAVSTGADKHLIENSHLLWITESNLKRLSYGASVELPKSLKELMSSHPEDPSPSSTKFSPTLPGDESSLHEEMWESKEAARQGLYPQLYSRVKSLLSEAFTVGTELLSA